jgi:hypothetical protein
VALSSKTCRPVVVGSYCVKLRICTSLFIVGTLDYNAELLSSSPSRLRSTRL